VRHHRLSPASTGMSIWSSTTSAWVVAWRETNVEDTDLEAVIDDLLEGQYGNPVCVIGFNVSEGWVRDVSEAIAQKLRERCAEQNRELPDSVQQFVEQAADLGRADANPSYQTRGGASDREL
jgi:hypothetical protein